MAYEGSHAHAGAELHFCVDGAIDAPWVVFSNSLATNVSVWDQQVAVLGQHFRVLRYDQRGHGASTLGHAPIDFEVLGDDVLALLDRMEIDRCTFVGLSMGVPTGLSLWQRAPKRIERLVLVDGQSRTAEGGKAQWEDRIAIVEAQGMGSFADVAVSRWFSEDFIASGAAEPIRKGIAETSPEGFAACAGALASFDLAGVLPTIYVPTLLLAGENDGQMPAVMARMAAEVPDCAFSTIAGAGHLPNVEQPEAFNRAIMEFMSATAANARKSGEES
ncbi:alpha/beta fold hydrolase [Novosphingobium sp. AAP83]|uniref:alpha/beta fold hydrolase n=1 Tax=Novosphingobium sp. AAP83 TaxID=1523425 RepID=UPI000AA52921|nr:alpha/beta fold hydrolase [Novosphingobium sp. AAP83]